MDNRMLGLSSAETKMKRGNPKGDTPHLAHDFAWQSVVCYTRYMCVCEKSVFVNRVLKATADEKSLVSVSVSITEVKLFYSQIEGI